ncbi:uncharacterized protein C4orf51 homolog isoform X2 [Canis lupus baileyi]|uniref:uncharacterized protein C4orf51 homolog isoform X2 n=1 Tax=Canis lupus baileyi TaxID=143281 RepID=UPI003B973642
MCFEGQTQHLISSPNSSAFNPIVCRADSRESTDAKDMQWTEGDTARLTSNLKIHMQLYQQDMANVIQDEREKGKRRAHQILFGGFSPAPPNYEKPCMRSKKPASKNLINYHLRKKDFLKTVRIFLLVIQQWIPGVVSAVTRGALVNSVHGSLRSKRSFTFSSTQILGEGHLCTELLKISSRAAIMLLIMPK